MPTYKTPIPELTRYSNQPGSILLQNITTDFRLPESLVYRPAVPVMLIFLLGLLGCAQPQAQTFNVTAADAARCRYETQAAYAGVRERTLGDMIDNSVGQNRLMRSCLEAKSASNDERLPLPRPPVPSAGSRVQAGKPVPPFCLDPEVTNPYLRAECPR